MRGVPERKCQDYSAVQPPSTSSRCPVVAAAAGLARIDSSPHQLFRLHPAAQGHPVCELGLNLLGSAVIGSQHTRRLRGARPDGVDGNAVLPPLSGKGARQAGHTVLAGNIRRAVSGTNGRELGADINDAAPTLLYHGPDGCLGAEEQTLEIGVYGGVPIRLGNLEGRLGDANAGRC